MKQRDFKLYEFVPECLTTPRMLPGMSGQLLAGMMTASLLLSACGGGGESNTLTVAPVKGKFGAGCGIVVSNPANSFKAEGTTDVAGMASVSIPRGVSGPYVISVLGGDSCNYFNEASNTMAPFTAADSLHAVVPAASISGTVAVTPLTEMQYAYLAQQAGGMQAVTDAAAIAAVPPVLSLAKSMGLLNATIDVQNIFALPPVVPDSGITPVELGQDAYSAMFGIVAAEMPTDPMAAVAAHASLAKATALSAASSPAAAQALMDAEAAMAGILPVTQAVSYMYGPASAVGMASPISVAAATQAAVTEAANASAAADASASYLADLVSGGVHLFSPGYQYTTAAGTTTVAPVARSVAATKTGTSAHTTYPMLRSFKELLSGIWSTLVGNSGNTDYVLTAAGWSDDRSTPIEAALNQSGTLTVNDDAYGRYGSKVLKIDLSGTPIASAVVATDANGLATGSGGRVAGNFPDGSIEYHITDFGLTAQDIYEVYSGSLGAYVHVLDANGIQLSALPDGNTQFCVAGFRFIPTATASNYDVYANPDVGCPALVPGQLPDGTVSFAPVQVNGQQLLSVGATTQQTSYPPGYVSGALPGIINGTFNSSILTLVDGKAYMGMTTSKGADTAVLFGTRKRYNRTAIDAQMNAANLPLF